MSGNDLDSGTSRDHTVDCGERDEKNDPVSMGKMRWRCRRGMRELDAAMLAYLDNHYKDADDQEQAQFQRLLELQDPELMGLVSEKIKNQQRNPDFDQVISKICASLSA